MKATPADWRPQVQQGDVLRISATYESKLASWYEVMGIMVVWEAWNDQAGVNPFAHKLDELREKRRCLAWVKIDKPYVFEGPDGKSLPLSEE